MTYIATVMNVFFSNSGFLIVASLGQEMPRFSKTVDLPKQLQQQQEVDDEQVKASNQSHHGFTEIKFWKSLLFMVYVYYCISCGLEAFFQVQMNTGFPCYSRGLRSS